MKHLAVKHHHALATSEKSDNVSYPSMSIDHKSGLKLHKHKVGKTGHMKVRYKVTGQQAYRDGSGHTSLDITHAEDMEDPKEEAGETSAKEKKEG